MIAVFIFVMDKKVQKEIETIVENFLEVCEAIVDELDERPFHLRGRLNFGALDAVVSTLMQNGIPENLSEKYDALLGDEDFKFNVTYNTSDDSAVTDRLQAAAQYLV